MALKTRTTAENGTEMTAEENIAVEEKMQNTADSGAEKGRFIYIGPSLETGLTKNAVFRGTRKGIEEYLNDTLEKYPQARLLIVTTEKLVQAQEKVRKSGTVMNKYYNDLVSLSAKK